MLPLQLRWMEFACVVLSTCLFYSVHWRTVSTLCTVSGKMFVVTSPGIEMIDLANAVKGSDIIFSNPANHKIYKYIIQYDKLEDFAGSGDENCIDGPVTECSFRQPCGVAAEFNNGRCLHSGLNGRNCSSDLPRPITNTTKFLKVVGDLYKAFLVHEKGNTFDSFKLQLALELVQLF